MKRSFFIALGMAIVLFGYGYFVTNAGHDHKDHSRSHREHNH